MTVGEQGDGIEQLEDCVRAEYARLVGVVALVTDSVPLAEDAVQEAFAKAWERSRRGERFDHLAAWVVTVALNHARSGRRRSASERRAVDRLGTRPPVGVTPRPDAPEIGLAVRDALDGLPRRQREAVVLYYFLDLDVAGVAELLHVSPGTVKTALDRARKKLAVVLAEHDAERR
jgi:RNA polymerase sigma-70 factor (ECF subfamily)